jgi:hypothetical protein
MRNAAWVMLSIWYRPHRLLRIRDAKLRLPIYLDADVQAYLIERAAEKGIALDKMVNALLKQGIQMRDHHRKTVKQLCDTLAQSI